MEEIIASALEKSYSYTEYRNHISHLLLQGLSTGHTQSEDLTHYSSLNEVRMNRLDKTIKILPEVQERLKAVKGSYIWLVISEGWCGDAAQLLPIIKKMADENELTELRIVLRDENPELMDKFLTNGARSIPKLLIVDTETNAVFESWGPRPAGAAQLIAEYKAAHGKIDETAKTELQKWYLNDKGHSTMLEIAQLAELIEKRF